MPDRFPCKCYPCGYWSRRTDACGLIPEHRDILCPFADAALKACRKEVAPMASSSIKMECPKCRQTARITSRSTLLVCGRCGCPMDEAPPRAYYNHRYRRSILRDPDDEPSGC